MNTRSLIMIMLLIGISTIGFAANYYAIADGAWHDATTWSLSSGGPAGTGFPDSGDDVFIGEGSGSYTVTVPSAPGDTHSCARLYMGSGTGNSARANLVFEGNSSSLTVAGSVYIYRASVGITRTISVGQGNFDVGSSVHLGSAGDVGNTSSISQITISGGTITMNGLNYYGVANQSQVIFTGSGLLNLYGNFSLVEGQGTLDPGTGTVAFVGTNLQTIDAGANISFFNLKANNDVGLYLNGQIDVYNIWSQLDGVISGTPPNIDGFASSNKHFIRIYANDIMMNGFTINMTTDDTMPEFINRQWNIQGTYTGNKILTFYWNHLDDLAYDWVGNHDTPWVWNDGLASNGPFEVVDDPHFLQTVIDDASFTGIYKIGTNNQTLPVELSSFSAVVTSQNFVKLEWTTQSETGVLGYNIYRNTINDLNGSVVASPLITAGNTSAEQLYSFTDLEVVPGVYYYWLQNVDMDGTSGFYGSIMVTLTEDIPEGPPPVIPTQTNLTKVFPNPFNPWTTISYQLVEPEYVHIAVYNIKGQLVRTLVSEQKAIGAYRVNWYGKDASGHPTASGLYYIRMTAGTYSQTRKAVLIQ